MTNQRNEPMKSFLKLSLSLFLACFIVGQGLAQCTADYDFGNETLGVSPNPELGEQFEPGIVGQSYEDVLHILSVSYTHLTLPTISRV